MTRERLYGSDVPFMAWMRQQSDLPSYSNDFGFVATDVDVLIHVYMKQVDGVGTREIQPMLHLETKSRNAEPNKSQLDTLFKQNLFCGRRKMGSGQIIWHHGVFVLSMSDTTPDDSQTMRWGCFNGNFPLLTWRQITRDELKQLLKFELHPKTFTANPFRRHHKTYEVLVEQTMELGFVTPVLITNSS